jgi:hypothetical protein
MIGKQKEKWLELCELAATEQNPDKLMAFVTEIDHLLEAQQRRNKSSSPGFLSSSNSAPESS